MVNIFSVERSSQESRGFSHERFNDYWDTDFAYEDYKYDITILEQLVYGFIGTVGGIIAGLGLLFTFPLWVLPYMIHKAHTCKTDRQSS